jgi:lysyl-tRNA synthetase class 2
VAVAVFAAKAVVFAFAHGDPSRQWLSGVLIPPGLPSEAHVLSALVGLALLVLVPRLWDGTRTAVPLAALGLAVLAVIQISREHYGVAWPELGLSLLLALAWPAFPSGCRNRPRATAVGAAIAAWVLTYVVLIAAPSSQGSGTFDQVRLHVITRNFHVSTPGLHLVAGWSLAIELLIACAVAISVVALRSLLRPMTGVNSHTERGYRSARAILERHGEDSLSPFMLRPDKALQFAAGGVLAYRVIGETAVVSGDPVAPDGCAPDVLGSMLALARARGWRVALWGASAEHLSGYAALGMHAVCLGEEAVVDPSRFTLEGRPVRKLRQSVHRVERRGWDVSVFEGRGLSIDLEAEINTLEAAWRAQRRRMLGFAMGMGSFYPDVAPDDLYVLGRAPDGELRAVMRFAAHCGKLSLDTMRRVGETPNGLNEALVCQALAAARERGVREVSLNYAGLAHLVRRAPDGHPIQAAMTPYRRAGTASRGLHPAAPAAPDPSRVPPPAAHGGRLGAREGHRLGVTD